MSDKELKLTSKQLDCLCSPVRVNLYEAIRRRKLASVAELAADMQKTVHSLYYHLRALTKVGLIRIREHRRVGKRDEAIYEAISDRLVIDKDNSNRAYVEGLIKTVRIALRKSEREHREARYKQLESDQFAFLRLQSRLSPKDAEQLRMKIKDLGRWVRKRDRPLDDPVASAISITCLNVPLGNVEKAKKAK